MGLSSSKQTTTTEPSKFAQPFIASGANAISDTYNQNKGSVANIASSVQSLIPGLLGKYQAGDPNVTGATNYGANVLGGQYLGGNPYATPDTNISTYGGFAANPNINPNGFLDSIINQTNHDVTNAAKAGFGSRGSFGGTPYINALTKGLASNESGLRYNDANNVRQMQVDDFNRLQAAQAGDYAQTRELQANDANAVRGLNANNYAAERNNQQQVAANAPQLAAANYLGITPLLAAAQSGAELPFSASNNYATALAGLLGNQTTTTQKAKGNVFQSLLGGVGQGLGAYAGAG